MMELLKKNDDCYFYYYSSCMKGESCPFRHEPSALGIETVCNFWKQGKCSKLHCNFRHMEVRKNRNVIPCYWESQPSGCRKPHCPFQHKSSREGLQSESDSSKDLILPVGTALHDSHDHGSSADGNEHDNTPANFVLSPPVDPLVVNFEEESDNESVPSTTPVKRAGRSIHIKTLEEIRLERIQAESAAFYQYDDSDAEVLPSDSSPDRVPAVESPKSRGVSRDPPEQLELRKRISGRRSYQNGDATVENVSSPAFKVLTLDEIRQSKRRKEDNQNEENSIENNLNSQKQVENIINPIVEETKEKIITENLYGKRSPRKRAHSPVVFDVSDKKVKQVILSDKKDIEIKSSPSKPTVAVAARKRPHSEDPIEDEPSKPTDSNGKASSEKVDDIKTSSTTIPARPTRKIWRSSRQIRKDEQESIKKCDDTESDTVSSSSVFTRKLRLRKNNVQSNINSSVVNNASNDNLTSQIKEEMSISVPDFSTSCVTKAEDSVSLDTLPSNNSSPCTHVNSTPKLRRRSSLAVNVATPSSQHQGDSDEDMSLLSPTQDSDMSLSTSRAADDILQDIDDLLND